MKEDLTEPNNRTDNISGNSDYEYARGENPNSLKNLKPFPKGVSGNPLGKPHRFQKLASKLNTIGDGAEINYDGQSKGFTKREAVLRKVWEKATQGDIKFIQLLAYLGCLDR